MTLLTVMMLAAVVMAGLSLSVRSSASSAGRAAKQSASATDAGEGNRQATLETKAAHQQATPAALHDLSQMSASNHWSARNRYSFANPLAASLSATKTDTVFTDVDGDTKADPGDTLEYTITINNTSAPAGDVTNVVFTDTLTDTNLQFVAGSVSTTPLARNDSYTGLVGNVSITKNAAGGVLANDSDPDGVGPALTASAGATSAQGGNVTMNSDGSFTYDPPAGFEGTDTFTYTLNDGEGNTDTATVSFTISGMVWFINNNAGACPSNCDGRLSHPFTTLSAFETINDDGLGNNPNDNDHIFIYESSTAYTGPVTLRSGQKLIGQDATASLETITGLTPPAGSPSFPAMNTGGNIVKITSAANAINLNSAGTTNLIRGLTVGGTTGIGISGSGFGTLTVLDTSITDTGTRTGQALGLTTGTLSATFANLVSSGATNGISLTGINGTLTINAGALSTLSGADFLVSGGAADITFPGTITNTAGRSVDIQGHTGGTIAFSGAISDTGAGIFLDNNTGATVNFSGGLTLNTGTNNAFTATGGGTVNITGSTNTIVTTSGTALNITNTNIGGSGLNFQSINAGNGTLTPANGIVLDNTGTSGGLTVVGTGGTCVAATPTCSGGRIQKTAGANGATAGNGIYLNNTKNVSLTRMRIDGHPNFAIKASSVDGFTLNTCVVDGANGNDPGNDEGSVFLLNNKGTNTITSCDISGGFEDNLRIQHDSATAVTTVYNVTGTIFHNNDATNGNAQVNLKTVNPTMSSSSNVTWNFTGNDQFNNGKGDGILVNFEGPGQHTLNVQNATFNTNFQSMDVASNFDADVNYVIKNNTFLFADSNSVAIGSGSSTTANAVITGLIQGNTWGSSAAAHNSGSNLGFGLILDYRGLETAQFTVHSNTFYHTEINGIRVIGQLNDGDLAVQLTSNTVNTPDDDAGGGFGVVNGMDVSANTTSHDICLDPRQNVSVGSGGGFGLEVRQNTAANTFQLEGFGGTGTNAASVESFLSTQNPGNTVHVRTGSSVVQYTSGNCTTPATTFAGGGGGGTQLRKMTSAKRRAPASTDDVLLAGGGEGRGGPELGSLNQAELYSLVYPALQRLTEAGISSEDIARLQSVPFEIADLEGGLLATASDKGIRIDVNGAGHGWYIDQSAAADEEFPGHAGSGRRRARANDPVLKQMDLLTVVMREMVYFLSQGRNWTIDRHQGFMGESLLPGTRRLPDSKVWTMRVQDISSINQLPSWFDHLGLSSQSQNLDRSEAGAARAALDSTASGNNPDVLTAHASSVKPENSEGLKSDTDRQAEATAPVSDTSETATTARYVEIASNGYMPTQLGKALRGKQPPMNTAKAATLSSLLAPDVTTNVGTLPQGKSITIKFRAQIKSPLVAPAGSVSNQGQVTADGGINLNTDDPDATGSANPTVTPLDVADVKVAKTDSVDPVTAGNNLTYTVTVTNDGPSAATAVQLTDNLPANATVTFVSGQQTNGPSFNCTYPLVNSSGGTVSCSIATLNSGASATFEVVLGVGAGTPDNTSLSNTATVSTTKTDPDSSNNTKTETTLVQARADLKMEKAGPPTGNVGDPTGFDYILTVTNQGPSNNTGGFTVTDTLPTGTTFQSTGSSAGCSAVGQVVTCVDNTGLAVLGVKVFTIHVTIDPIVVGGTNLQNSSTVASNGTTDQTAANNTATPVSTIAQANADLSITKSGPSTAVAGDPAGYDYTITVTNNGPSANTGGFTVTDTLPAGLTFQSTGSSAGCSAVGQVVTCVDNTGLAVLGDKQFTIHVKVGASVADGTVLSNTASVASNGTNDPVAANNNTNLLPVNTTVSTSADIVVTKTDSPDPVTAGTQLTYTVTITNNGPSDAQTVQLTDAVPANTTFASAQQKTGPAFNCTNPSAGSSTGSVSCSIATLASGASASFEIKVNVDADAADNSSISNTATGSSATDDPNANNTEAIETTTVQARADLKIDKSGPATAKAGDVAGFDYTLTVTNLGPSNNTGGASVTDTLPGGLTFQTTGSSAGCSAVGQVVTCADNSGMGVSATKQYTVHVTLGSFVLNSTVLSNTATVASDGTTDPTSGNNTSSVVDTTAQAEAKLKVTKTASPDPAVTAGNNLTYTITIANDGPSDAQNLKLTDTVPAGTVYDSFTAPGGWTRTDNPLITQGGTGTITVEAATLAAGTNAQFTFVVTVHPNTPHNTILTNIAAATTTTTDPDLTDNSATKTTTVNARPDLSVTKTDAVDPLMAGEVINYQVVVTNNGPSTATNVVLTDRLSPSLTNIQFTPSVGSCSPGLNNKWTCDLGDMNSLAVATINVSAKSSSTPNKIFNVARVAANEVDPDLSDNEASQDTTLVGFRNLFLFTDPIVTGGCANSVGKLYFTSPAPAGVVINFQETSTAVTIPSVTTTGGELSVDAVATTSMVSAEQLVNITAHTTRGPNSRLGRLKILPVRFDSLTFAPNPVTGGTPVAATLTLTCPAPQQITVTLKTNRAAAKPDQTQVVFNVGDTSKPFTITTLSPPSGPVTVVITATGSNNVGYIRSELIVNP